MIEKTEIDLTISVINTNNRELLRACLQSIFQNTQRISLEVYVVDNACTDGSVEMVKREFPQVKLVHNQTRLGFCANHNQVLKVGTGRYLLILNEDTVILPAALKCMVEFMDNHPAAGILGPMLLNEDGSFQASYADFPTLLSELLAMTGLATVLHGAYFPSHPPARSQQLCTVDWVGGACLMIRRETMEQIELLDESFVVYSEEKDWCYRAKQAGWEVYYLPQARVIHLGGRAWKQLDNLEEAQHRVRRRFRLTKSKLLFFRKHYGRLSEILLRLVLLSTSLVKAGGWFCVSLLGHRDQEIAQVEAHAHWRMAWEDGSWQ